MVEVAVSKRGRVVRRATLGEENVTTEHNAMTLRNCRVTARIPGNCSC